MNKIFDLRSMIGTFFLVIGLLLFAYSFFSGVTLQRESDINRWCGVIFSLFGSGMLLSLLFASKEN
jgi:hypothetical protein